MIAGLDMSVSFANSNDLDTILKAAKATKWELPPLESRLLNDDIKNDDIAGNNCVTFSVTVTNAWLPKEDLLLHDRTRVDKSASVYVRYKFFDHDSVVSTPSPLPNKQPHSIDARFENLTSSRIAHKKSFVCKRSRPLHWYLREEKLEIQIWLTHSTTSKQSRPSDADKLLGSCCVELSSISEWRKEQHISGSFPMFKAGVDSLGGQLRVYVSMKLGEVPDPIPDTKHECVFTDESDALQKSPVLEKPSPKPTIDDHVLGATVTIERAFHLPRVNDLETDELVYPNVFVSFDGVDTTCSPKTPDDIKLVTMATRIVTSSENVSWNNVKTVSLPKSLLTGSDGGMVIKVWHRDRLYMDDSKNPNQTSIGATDRMLGFATVDLSVLRAGFRDVNGWYNILDIHGQCQGQLKVAVTPTRSYDSSQPNSARSNDMFTMLPFPAPPLASIPSNFLHKIPIDVPVQTPSGSMYVPGVQSSADIVESKSCVLTCPEQYAGRFHADFCHGENIRVAPTASMFRYVTSDRQQANLVNTLEKQISELESIKKRFEERKQTRFHETVTHEDESSQNDRKPLTSPSESKFPDCRHEDEDLEPSKTGNIQSDIILPVEVPRPEILPVHSHDSRDRLSRSKQQDDCDSVPRNSIHLSLYQSRKNADLDDRVLSDNDVDSDIEFVQPQSLNESLNLDGNQQSQDSNDRILRKPPHVTPSQSNPNIIDRPTSVATKQLGSPDFGDAITPSRSEGHSALDDTSLWLTGSTLRVSGFISDDENGGKADEASEEEQGDDHGRESVRSESSQSVVTPLDQEICTNHDQQTATTEDLQNPTINEARPRDDTDTADSTDDNSDTTNGEHASPLISSEYHPHDIDESLSPTAKVMIGSQSSKSPSDEERSACSGVPDQGDEVGDSPEIVAAAFSDCEQNTTSADEDSDSEESSVKSQNEENQCPNCKMPSPKTRQRDIVSNFYPPSKNIQTSIREIQEATLAHKVSCTSVLFSARCGSVV